MYDGTTLLNRAFGCMHSFLRPRENWEGLLVDCVVGGEGACRDKHLFEIEVDLVIPKVTQLFP